jgi:hypothetical protein
MVRILVLPTDASVLIQIFLASKDTDHLSSSMTSMPICAAGPALLSSLMPPSCSSEMIV